MVGSDDCFINEGDIYLIELWKEKEKKRNIEETELTNTDKFDKMSTILLNFTLMILFYSGDR